MPPAQVINVTILSVASERPDPRLEAWQGQELAFFFHDANSSLADPALRVTSADVADVHAAVHHMAWCPVADGNVLNITVRWRRRRRRAVWHGGVSRRVADTCAGALRRRAWRARPRLGAPPCGATWPRLAPLWRCWWGTVMRWRRAASSPT